MVLSSSMIWKHKNTKERRMVKRVSCVLKQQRAAVVSKRFGGGRRRFPGFCKVNQVFEKDILWFVIFLRWCGRGGSSGGGWIQREVPGLSKEVIVRGIRATAWVLRNITLLDVFFPPGSCRHWWWEHPGPFRIPWSRRRQLLTSVINRFGEQSFLGGFAPGNWLVENRSRRVSSWRMGSTRRLYSLWGFLRFVDITAEEVHSTRISMHWPHCRWWRRKNRVETPLSSPSCALSFRPAEIEFNEFFGIHQEWARNGALPVS